MNILVCGGRRFGYDLKEVEFIHTTLDNIEVNHHVESLTHGDAKGADTVASMWASMNKIPQNVYPADWARYGRSAGHKRNQQMLDEENIGMVVAFPGGAGTADMVRKATIRGITVEIPTWRGAEYD